MTVLPVQVDGLVDLGVARAAIAPGTALVAAMLVNNEIGVIQPIAELAAMAHAGGRAVPVRCGAGLWPGGDSGRVRSDRDLGTQDSWAQGNRRAVDPRRGVD